jgi:hydroxyacylglutathione hydrolase
MPPPLYQQIHLKSTSSMKIEQIYTGCLAQGAYYIESEGEAVVIDPLREVESYLEKAERQRQNQICF